MNNDWREYSDELTHHGIKGQKWGVRRFQNADGTLTSAGRSRYGEGADKVERKSVKASNWERRAANAKTRFGSDLSTAVAVSKRIKADKAASKAEGDYKFTQFSKNASRNKAAIAETHANVASGLKERADQAEGRKHNRLMDRAVTRLSSAENAELAAKKWRDVANAPFLTKGGLFVTQTVKDANNTYTSAGRKSKISDKALEAVGDAVLNQAFKMGMNKAADNTDSAVKAEVYQQLGNRMNFAGTTTAARNMIYKTQNSADERWDRVMKGK